MNNINERIAFIDIESAGLEFTRPIIQIAAIAVGTDLRELESVEIKIHFDESDADPAALTANRYDAAQWQLDAIPGEQAASQFAQFLRRHATFDMISRSGGRYCVAQLAGHNAERFDGPFLHHWYRRLGLFCPARYMPLCTKQRALWLFEEDKSLTPPRDFKLGTLCQYFGVPLREHEAHDALYDVRANVELYRAMRGFQPHTRAQAA